MIGIVLKIDFDLIELLLLSYTNASINLGEYISFVSLQLIISTTF